jgi:pimeloyl-ACP methyl ester carboxylesterase
MGHRALCASTLVAACLVALVVVGASPLEGAPVETTSPSRTAGVEEDARATERSTEPSAPALLQRHILVLHGACMAAESTFDRLERALPAGLAPAAPSGNARCQDGSLDWVGTGTEKAAALDVALADAAPADNVLVGFSRGAFVARDVALAKPGRFSGLVFIGASMQLDVAALRAAGVRRVVLASGELDSAYASMRRNRDALDRGGIEARFVSLGRVYHTLPSDAGERLRAAMAWVAETTPPS